MINARFILFLFIFQLDSRLWIFFHKNLVLLDSGITINTRLLYEIQVKFVWINSFIYLNHKIWKNLRKVGENRKKPSKILNGFQMRKRCTSTRRAITYFLFRIFMHFDFLLIIGKILVSSSGASPYSIRTLNSGHNNHPSQEGFTEIDNPFKKRKVKLISFFVIVNLAWGQFWYGFIFLIKW